MCVHLRQHRELLNKGSPLVTYSTQQLQDAPSAAKVPQPFDLLGETDDAPRRGVPLLPLSFLGVGVLVAWLCCTHLPGVFLLSDGMGAGSLKTTVDYGMRAGDIGFFVAYALLLRRLGPISSHPRVCCALIVLTSLGTFAATMFLAAPTANMALVAALSVVTGLGGAALFLLWAEVYAQLGNTRSLLFGAAGCVLAGLISLVISYLDTAVANVAIALLPVASGVMAALSLSRLPGEACFGRDGVGHVVCASPEVSYPVPWKLVILMALAGFASGFAGSLLVEAEGIGATHRILATVVSGVVLLAAFFLRKGDLDVRFFAWGTLPLALVFFAVIPLLGSTAGTLVSFLVKLAYVAFALFVLFMLANVCYRHAIPSARVFAYARASSEAAMFAGILLRRWMRSAGILDGQEMLWVISLIGLVATVGCVLLWHTERSVTSDWGVSGVDAASGFKVKSPRDELLERMDALAREKGLTPREQEILSLLAQGYTAPAIEGELFMSHNTLKTHLRHIYGKLEVHTRAEALEMLGVSGSVGR